MELTIPPPHALLYVAFALLAAVLFTALRRRGSVTSRLIRVAVGVLFICGLLVFVYRPSYIKVDNQGITSNSGGSIAIPWTAVSSSAYIADLPSSDYNIASKIRGVAVGAYRIGTFRTAGGQTVRLVAQQGERALIVKADGKLYEFSPQKIEGMANIVARYVAVSGWPPAN